MDVYSKISLFRNNALKVYIITMIEINADEQGAQQKLNAIVGLGGTSF